MSRCVLTFAFAFTLLCQANCCLAQGPTHELMELEEVTEQLRSGQEPHFLMSILSPLPEQTSGKSTAETTSTPAAANASEQPHNSPTTAVNASAGANTSRPTFFRGTWQAAPPANPPAGSMPGSKANAQSSGKIRPVSQSVAVNTTVSKTAPTSPALAAATSEKAATESPQTASLDTPPALDPSESEVQTAKLSTIDAIVSRKEELTKSELDAELKKKIEGIYQKATEFLERTAENEKKRKQLQESMLQAPEKTARIKEQLKTEAPEIVILPTEGSAELEQRLTAAKVKLSEATQALSQKEQKTKDRLKRKAEIPALLEEYKKSISETEERLSAPPVSTDTPYLTLAQQTEQESYLQYLKQLQQLLPVEQASYAASSEHNLLEKDLLQKEKKQLEDRVKVLETKVAEAKQLELRRQAREARRALADADPALKSLAERNAELTEKRSVYLDYLKQTADELDRVQQELTQVTASMTDAEEKEQTAGLTTSIGLQLRNDKRHLPSVILHKARQREVERETVRLQVELYELEKDRDRLGDIQAETEQVLQEIRASGKVVATQINLEEMTAELLEDRRAYLGDLLTDVQTSLDNLGDISVQRKSLIEKTEEFRAYIDERILWVRSAGVYDLGTMWDTTVNVRQLATPSLWIGVYHELVTTMGESPLSAIGFGLICLLLVALHGFFCQSISRTGMVAEGQLSPPFSSTIYSSFLTVLVAGVGPLLMWMAGRQLKLTAGEAEFSFAVGQALQVSALVFGSVELFRQLCRPNGVAEKHLQWPERAVRALHGNLVGLLVLSLPLVFWLELSHMWNDGAGVASLGRTAFVLAMFWFSWRLHRMLRPRGVIFRDIASQQSSPALRRMLQCSYLSAVLGPVILAGLAIAGYQYTAEQLFLRLELTLWLAIGLVILSSLIANYAWQAHVRLVEIREKLHSVVSYDHRFDETNPSQTAEEIEEDEIDFSVLQAQMKKVGMVAGLLLFALGNWWIWAEVTPALQRFNGIPLWHISVDVAQVIGDGNEQSLVTKTELIPITLGHLLFSIGLVVLTTVACGNIPGLLELAILRRLPLDAGARNAITTLTRYFLATFGIMMSAKMIGIDWSSVQWLLAALTVGLGFGLQEIFANFVSGLIILFERPIRIGDTVTIDGVTGNVARIQIRATTICDHDKKEYLVPNKEFVTGRVLNWTLSDQVNRIVINVGVGYNSDQELARELMLKVAREHPLTMEEPGPVTTFEGFGDNALNLVLRCYLPELKDRLKTMTELHSGIHREFRAHGIEIPYPQMDLHIKQNAENAVAEPVQDMSSQAAA